jgi:chromosome partitioning protein
VPVIVFVSPKGGAGKSTSALLLSQQLATYADVGLLDGDPNRPLTQWGKGANKPERLTIYSNADEENILDVIDEAAQKNTFVVVDLEGTAAKIVLLAVSQADLVIIPTQGSQLDAEQATRGLRVVKQQEKMSRRTVPHGILLTRTGAAIRTRTMSHIIASYVAAGVRVFNTEIVEREAYKAMFSFAEPLSHLDRSQVSNVDKAIANAEAFAAEVVAMLRETAQDATSKQEVA